MYGSEADADDDSSLRRRRCRCSQNRTADPEGPAVGSNETIESDDCAIAGLNRRCPGIGCVWQSNRGVPEPAKGLKDPAFTVKTTDKNKKEAQDFRDPAPFFSFIQLKTDLCLRSRAGIQNRPEHPPI